MVPYIRELYQITSCISPANYPVIFDGPNTLMLSNIGNVVNIYCVVKNCVSGFAQAGFKLPGKFGNVTCIWLTVVYSATGTGTGLLYSHKICFDTRFVYSP